MTVTREETKRDKVDRLSVECVRVHAPNVPSHKIHDYLKSNGVDVTAASLSAYLSKNGAIAYDLKGKGWNLQDSEIPYQGSPETDTAGKRLPAVNGGASPHRHVVTPTPV